MTVKIEPANTDTETGLVVSRDGITIGIRFPITHDFIKVAGALRRLARHLEEFQERQDQAALLVEIEKTRAEDEDNDD